VSLFPAAQQHHLVFEQPRPCNEQELRRLSPTVHRGNSALAVHVGTDGELQVWGVVFLGSEGREVHHYVWDSLQLDSPDKALAPTPDRSAHESPRALVLHVRAPGALTFYCGHQLVLTLHQGRIEGHGFQQFPPAWAQGHFTHNEDTPLDFAAGEVEIVIGIALQLLRRSIGRVRNDGHGGMLVLVPPAAVPDLLKPVGLLRPKYRVQPDARHYDRFLTAIMARLRELKVVGWRQYQQTADQALRALSQQMDWFTELMADLMAVDGALVISQELEMIGFGVEIHAPLVATDYVYRALDVDAKQLQAVPINSGGTRHRAAYRLCAADARCLVIVVSQDGAIKLVRQLNDKVVFWDQLAL